MAQKLWEKSVQINKDIERFTVGRDREMDLYLAKYDILGSMAHITMLESIGLLTADELAQLLAELKNLYALAERGEFAIEDGVEDVHSQVELMLTRRLGDVGKKIHSGRSRNDQVLLDLKLFTRAEIRRVIDHFSGRGNHAPGHQLVDHSISMRTVYRRTIPDKDEPGIRSIQNAIGFQQIHTIGTDPLGLRQGGIEVVSCPTCGRTNIDLIPLANQVETMASDFEHLNIKVAVMGCVVNGPGEAKHADFGIAGGINEGYIFKKGEIIAKVPENQLLNKLEEIIIKSYK